MKRFYTLLFVLFLVVTTNQKAIAQTPPVVHDPVNNIVLSAIQSVTQSGLYDVFGEVSKYAKIAQDVIKTSKEIIDIYETSTELIEMSDRLIGVYEAYFTGIGYIAENSLYLDVKEVEYLVKTLDACAFGLKANAIERNRGVDAIAGGKLKKTVDLLTGAVKGGSISLFEINKSVEELQNEINKAYYNTLRGIAYTISTVEEKKIRLGLYTVEEYAKDIKAKMKK